jgi:hypothetical protein
VRVVTIHIGAIYGGPEGMGTAVHRAIVKLAHRIGDVRGDEDGSLDLVFHVPGSILKPEHVGLRTGRF